MRLKAVYDCIKPEINFGFVVYSSFLVSSSGTVSVTAA
jgi:hypothetical protein